MAFDNHSHHKPQALNHQASFWGDLSNDLFSNQWRMKKIKHSTEQIVANNGLETLC